MPTIKSFNIYIYHISKRSENWYVASFSSEAKIRWVKNENPKILLIFLNGTREEFKKKWNGNEEPKKYSRNFNTFAWENRRKQNLQHQKRTVWIVRRSMRVRVYAWTVYILIRIGWFFVHIHCVRKKHNFWLSNICFCVYATLCVHCAYTLKYQSI